ncbi:MAG: hypothetical protein QOG72_219 [Sphingomonadales bacterium]|jgi:hypothetical protein|nr:hypothetical protein [Sphingomonadales bacterium]
MKFMSRLDELLVATLEHALGVLHRESMSLGELYKLYSMNENTAALRRSAEKLKELKFIDFSGADGDRFFTRSLWTTSLGHEYVEMEFGDNLASFLERSGLIFDEAALFRDDPDVGLGGAGLPLVDSESWTGLISDTELNEEKRSKLIANLKQIESDLSATSLSNAEKAQARAYIAASIILSEMPEPPVDLIWEMITRAATIAGIASLFVSVIALMKA